MDLHWIKQVAMRFFPGKVISVYSALLLGVMFVAGCLPAFCANDRSVLDLNGRHIDPVQSNAGRLVVLIFVREDCPVSGRYAPTIQRLSSQYQKVARFYLVFPDKSELPPDIHKYLADFRYSIPGLRDPEHVLVKEAQVQITPEAAVFDAKGVLVYHGRIDNLYQDFGRSRPAPTSHELQEAIQSTLAGHPPSNQHAAAVGCYISDLQ